MTRRSVGIEGRGDIAGGFGRPLVSVLTPSFGQARWLADNLASVRRQTYALIEHVVMDGGSVDGSVELLESESRPGLAWRSEPDRGQSHALNKAFSASRGDIIGWLNSDDAYFGPTVVDDVVRFFAARPDVGVAYGHALLVSSDGLILQTLWAPPFSRSLLRLHDFIVQPAVFVRRSVLGVSFVDEAFDYAMDYELWLRLAGRTRFARLDRIVAIDRHHSLRKSYVLTSTGEADHRLLQKRYDVVPGRGGRALRKAVKIACRVAGIRLVRAAMHAPVVFTARRDGSRRLSIRQVLFPRRWMDSGG